MSAYSPFGYNAGRTVINNGATELGGLNDVNISNPLLNQTLVYTGSNWVNQASPGGGATLDALTDTTLLSLADKDLLLYDTVSSTWKNTPYLNTLKFDATSGFLLQSSSGQTRIKGFDTAPCHMLGGLFVKDDTDTNIRWFVDNAGIIAEYSGTYYGGSTDKEYLLPATKNYNLRFSDASSTFRIRNNTTDIFTFKTDGTQTGLTVAKMNDVNIDFPSLADKNFLRYNFASGKWVNEDTLKNFSFLTNVLQVGGVDKFDFSTANLVSLATNQDFKLNGASRLLYINNTELQQNYLKANTTFDFRDNSNGDLIQLSSSGANRITLRTDTLNFRSYGGTLAMSLDGANKELQMEGNLKYQGTPTNFQIYTTKTGGTIDMKLQSTNASSKFRVLTGTETELMTISASGVFTGLNHSRFDDVVLTSITDGQYLKWNAVSSKFVNATLPSAASLANFSFSNNLINVDAVGALGLTSAGQMTLKGDIRVDKISPGTLQFQQQATQAGYSFRFNDANTNSWFLISNNASQPLFRVRADGNTQTNGAIFFNNLANTQTNLQINDDGTIGGLPLSKISDTTITAPTNGQVLTYDSATSKWVNTTPSAGGSTGDYVFSTNNIKLSGQSTNFLTTTAYQSNTGKNQLSLNADLMTFGSSAYNPWLKFDFSDTTGEDMYIDYNRSTSAYNRMYIRNPSSNGYLNLASTKQTIITANQFVYNSNTTGQIYFTKSADDTYLRNEYTGANQAFRVYTNGTSTLALQILGDGSVYIPNLNPSDSRDKKNIQDLDKGLDFINKLRPVSYNLDERKDYYNDIPAEERPATVCDVSPDKFDGRHMKTRRGWGIVAQELLAIPGINENDLELIEERSCRYMVNYLQLIAPLIKSVQELKAKNEALEARITALETSP